ncbi:MAG: hypothetical protein HQM14_18530 [SAR324 cluster bacterium]|nr:hypothetical protein [SAR324 cluster bacterium]
MSWAILFSLTVITLIFIFPACGDVASEINGLDKILGVEEKDSAKEGDDDESSIIFGVDDLLTGIFLDAAVEGITFTGSGSSGTRIAMGDFSTSEDPK